MSTMVRRESHHRRAYRSAVTLVGTNFSQLPKALAATVRDFDCLRMIIGRTVKFCRDSEVFFRPIFNV
jgi:hypothetical protein